MDVIVLSSSEDETEMVPSENKNDTPEASKSRDIDFSLLDLPKVNVNVILCNYNLSKCTDQEKDISSCDIPEIDSFKTKITTDIFQKENYLLSNLPGINGIQNSKVDVIKEKEYGASGFSDGNIKSFDLQDESQSDSDYESQNVNYWEQYKEGLKNKYNVQVCLSSDEEKLEKVEEKEKKDEKKRKKRSATSKADTLEEKKRKQEQRQQEKLRKQEEAAKQKAMKQLNKKNRLQFNTDNNLKLMEIVLDENIEKHDYFTDFSRIAEETEVHYKLQSQIIPKSITWNRKVENNYVNERHEVCSDVKKIDEDQLMIVWDAEETVNHIFNNTFISTISNLKSLIPNKKLTLVMYKVNSYFKYIKSIKNRAMRDDILNIQGNQLNQKKSKTKADKTFANFPKVSRKTFEESLVDIQLLYKVNSRLIDIASDMILLIHQYTKSLAQRPSKMEKRQELSQFNWYASTDNRDTVKVDKYGNGLKRLWQQQLCQFTLMSLETSEAIVSVYKTPLQLIEAYAKCSPAEGEVLLKDIPIRRAAGPLTSTRKIGPELSRKVYIMFTAEDGDLYLNE